MHRRTRLRAAAGALALGLLLGGCATITTHGPSGEEIVMTQEEFGQYVEHVFRYHNQVMSELMEAAEDTAERPAHQQALKRAEQTMIHACEPLNEVVSETLSGESVGLGLKASLIDAAPACESASRAVEELIP